MRVKYVAYESTGVCRATRTPTTSDLLVSRACVLNHSRDKGRKDGPTSSKHGVNVRATGLSMSLLLSVSLPKRPQNGRNHHADSRIISWVPTMCESWWWPFPFTPSHVNPGNSPIQWGFLSPTWGRRNLQRTPVLRWLFWNHKCCTWQSQRWDPGLLLVSLSCFMIESGMKLRLMVQHRAGPPVLLALASPQPSHKNKEMGLISRLCEESCCWPTHPQAMVGVGT